MSSNSTTSPKSMSAGLLVAFTSSLCCITPVLAMFSGASGMAASFSWLEPFRPYLIVLTLGILGFAWYQKLKPRNPTEMDCDCVDERPTVWQSRGFLAIVTVFAGLMLAFPGYSDIFYPSSPTSKSSLFMEQDTTLTFRIVLDVKGMTCAGCETHIEHEVAKLDGVRLVDASYEDGTASVEFFSSKLKQEDIVVAINNTGYKVIDNQDIE